MKFEIHFEFRVSLRKFQNLNFWDATPHRSHASALKSLWFRTARMPRNPPSNPSGSEPPACHEIRRREIPPVPNRPQASLPPAFCIAVLEFILKELGKC
jgi:hypothetical protein